MRRVFFAPAPIHVGRRDMFVVLEGRNQVLIEIGRQRFAGDWVANTGGKPLRFGEHRSNRECRVNAGIGVADRADGRFRIFVGAADSGVLERLEVEANSAQNLGIGMEGVPA